MLRFKYIQVLETISLSFIFSLILSLIDIPAKAEVCSISLGGGGHTETIREDISQETTIQLKVKTWDFLRQTSGNCHFKLTLNSGSNVIYGSNINDRIRLCQSGGNDGSCAPPLAAHGSFPSPISVTFIPVNTSCGIVLGDNGRSQTFWGSDNKIDGITGWDFIRRTWGGCRFTVYNDFGGQGRSYIVNSGVADRIRVGWRIRSLQIEPTGW